MVVLTPVAGSNELQVLSVLWTLTWSSNEACGHSSEELKRGHLRDRRRFPHWLVVLLAEIGHELQIGDAVQIRANGACPDLVEGCGSCCCIATNW